MAVSRRRFRRLVREALKDLPSAFGARLENVAIVVEDWPAPALLREMGMAPDDLLFGLYQGVPLVERHHEGLGPLPDRILIFQGPIAAVCATEEEIKREVRKTVLHEVGHYFGLEEEELETLEDKA